MPKEKLTIVPVTLHPENKSIALSTSSSTGSSSICTIKTANAEISFYNGVEEHLIQTIMKELKHW
ncbi:hypothetical protein [Bacillus sp. FJAT-29937]|uniref:hypothetical protein n=1 Tax=Bacillus sp. FJAT-29937 TaxID=1720553 RepID=UPI000829F66B|nr:hypothetical protein [Bacillus sp. FJAT-29937]